MAQHGQNTGLDPTQSQTEIPAYKPKELMDKRHTQVKAMHGWMTGACSDASHRYALILQWSLLRALKRTAQRYGQTDSNSPAGLELRLAR